MNLKESFPNADSAPPLIKGKTNFLLYALIAWGFVLAGYVAWGSRLLRPMADDYTHGAALSAGPIAAMSNWWNTWAGDMAAIFVNVMIVGWPLQVLPWSFGSSIAFLACGLMVSITLLLILRIQVLKEIKSNRFRVLFLLPVFIVIWLSHWWVNIAFNSSDPFFGSTGTAITLWQNVNATYVFIPAVNVFFWILIERLRKKHWKQLWLIIPYVLVGIFVGMSGAVFAVSVLIFLTLMILGSLFDSRKFEAHQFTLWVTFMGAVILSSFVSYSSPGSQNRATNFPDISLNKNTFLQLLQTGFPSLSDWWKALANPGMLMSFALFLILAALLVLRGYGSNSQNIRKIAFGLIAFSLVQSLMNGMSEVFSYQAYWHRIQISTTLWLGVVALGFSLAPILLKIQIKTSYLFFASLFLTVVSTTAILQMSAEINSRYLRWEVGPAPTTYISDIENEVDRQGWQRISWLELRDQRGGPSRGLEPSPE
jgi:hypothetical protein